MTTPFKLDDLLSDSTQTVEPKKGGDSFSIDDLLGDAKKPAGPDFSDVSSGSSSVVDKLKPQRRPQLISQMVGQKIAELTKPATDWATSQATDAVVGAGKDIGAMYDDFSDKASGPFGIPGAIAETAFDMGKGIVTDTNRNLDVMGRALSAPLANAIVPGSVEQPTTQEIAKATLFGMGAAAGGASGEAAAEVGMPLVKAIGAKLGPRAAAATEAIGQRILHGSGAGASFMVGADPDHPVKAAIVGGVTGGVMEGAAPVAAPYIDRAKAIVGASVDAARANRFAAETLPAPKPEPGINPNFRPLSDLRDEPPPPYEGGSFTEGAAKAADDLKRAGETGTGTFSVDDLLAPGDDELLASAADKFARHQEAVREHNRKVEAAAAEFAAANPGLQSQAVRPGETGEGEFGEARNRHIVETVGNYERPADTILTPEERAALERQGRARLATEQGTSKPESLTASVTPETVSGVEAPAEAPSVDELLSGKEDGSPSNPDEIFTPGATVYHSDGRTGKMMQTTRKVPNGTWTGWRVIQADGSDVPYTPEWGTRKQAGAELARQSKVDRGEEGLSPDELAVPTLDEYSRRVQALTDEKTKNEAEQQRLLAIEQAGGKAGAKARKEGHALWSRNLAIAEEYLGIETEAIQHHGESAGDHLANISLGFKRHGAAEEATAAPEVVEEKNKGEKWLTAQYGSAMNSVSGQIIGDELHVSTSMLTEDMKGKGNGVKMYQALVDEAHKRGLTVVSSADRTPEASNMYGALKRRGYDVVESDGRFTIKPPEKAAKPAPKPKPVDESGPGTKHEHSSTQLNLPEDDADAIHEMAAQIPESDLGTGGRATDPHVTVKYGIHSANADGVRSIVENHPPITVTLGKTSVFPDAGEGEVVKIDIVDSPELRALNKKLAELPNSDKHPDYNPHITVAFVKKGLGEKYAGNDDLQGRQITIDKLTFSGKNGDTIDIPLQGKAETKAVKYVVKTETDGTGKSKTTRYAVYRKGATVDTFISAHGDKRDAVRARDKLLEEGNGKIEAAAGEIVHNGEGYAVSDDDGNLINVYKKKGEAKAALAAVRNGDRPRPPKYASYSDTDLIDRAELVFNRSQESMASKEAGGYPWQKDIAEFRALHDELESRGIDTSDFDGTAEWHNTVRDRIAAHEAEYGVYGSEPQSVTDENGKVLFSPERPRPKFTYYSGKDSENVRAVAKRRGDLGLVVSPLVPSFIKHIPEYPSVMVDNGAFGAGGFNPEKFEAMLDKIEDTPGAKERVAFVVAPDVPFDAEGSLKLFKEWGPKIRDRGFKVAFAAQNGIEGMLDKIPWDDFDVLFIGGDTNWKIGTYDGQKIIPGFTKMIREAADREKDIHVGRVNSAVRAEIANYGYGATSADGNSLSFGEDANMPHVEKWLNTANLRDSERRRPEMKGAITKDEMAARAAEGETVDAVKALTGEKPEPTSRDAAQEGLFSDDEIGKLDDGVSKKKKPTAEDDGQMAFFSPERVYDRTGDAEAADAIEAAQHDATAAGVPGEQSSIFDEPPTGVPESVGRADGLSWSDSLKKMFGIKAKPAEIARVKHIRRMIDELARGLDHRIEKGGFNFGAAKARGVYRPSTEVSRIKAASMLDTAAHEAGHYIADKFIGGLDDAQTVRIIGPSGANVIPDLLRMGNDLYGPDHPDKHLQEGIAELFKYYVVDPEYLEKRAPNAKKWLEDVVFTRPDMDYVARSFHQAQTDFQRWRKEPDEARIVAMIDRASDPAPEPRAKDWFRRAFAQRMDNTLSEWTRAVKLLGGFDKDGIDPSKLAMATKTAYSKVDAAYERGIPRFGSTVRETESVNHFINAIPPERTEEWYAYMIAERVNERASQKIMVPKLDEDGQPMYEQKPVKDADGKIMKDSNGNMMFEDDPLRPIMRRLSDILTEAPHLIDQNKVTLQKAVDDLLHQYVEPSMIKRMGLTYDSIRNIVEKGRKDEVMTSLADRYRKISNAVLMYELHGGAIDPGAYARMMESNQKYFSFDRHFSPDERTGGGSSTAWANPQSVESRLQGSGRGFKNPIESLYDGIAKAIINTDRHYAITKLLQMADRVKGGGNMIADRIPAPKIVDNIIFNADLMQQLADLGISEDALDEMQGLAVKRYREAAFTTAKYDRERYYPIFDGRTGKTVWYQVADRQLWDSFKNLGPDRMGWLDKTMSIPLRLFRLGVTASPDFALGTNPGRDSFFGAVFSKGKTRPPGYLHIKGMFEMAKKGEAYEIWADQVRMTGFTGAGRASWQRKLADVTRNPHIAEQPTLLIRNRHQLGILLDRTINRALAPFEAALEAVEGAPRVAEIAGQLEKSGSSREVGLSREMRVRRISEAGAAGADVTINFTKGGEWTKAVNRIVVPFLNAWWRDGVKVAGELNPMNVGKGAEARKRYATVMLRGTAFITAPALAIHFLQHDDKNYQARPDWMRYSGLTFVRYDKKGKFNGYFHLAMPQLAYEIFGVMPVLAAEYLEDHDADAFKRLKDSWMQNAAPNTYIPAATPAYEVWANKRTRDGTPIVPRETQDLDPSEQSSEYTGDFSKLVGKKAGVSPAKVEHVLTTVGGTIGKNMTAGADYVTRHTAGPQGRQALAHTAKDADTYGDIPVVRRFLRGSGNPMQTHAVQRVMNAYSTDVQHQNTLDDYRKQHRIEEANVYEQEHKAEIDLVGTAKEKGFPGPIREAHDKILELRKQQRELSRRRDLSDEDFAEKYRAINEKIVGIAIATTPKLRKVKQ